MLIEPARPDDLPAVTAIYAHHVRSGDATFDETPPSIDQLRPWFAAFADAGAHRLLVARGGGRVVGYAASLPYRAHPAFAGTVEFSVYLDPAATGAGLGRALYAELLALLRADTDVHTVVAGVALPNDASIALHLAAGFSPVGTFHGYAVKHGRRISSTWFELDLRTE